MTAPVPKVEVAFSTQPNDPSPVWVDVTRYVDVQAGVSLTHGRQDQYSQVQPASAQLTLNNADGRFTPGYLGSPYYPNVKKGRKIRVSVVDNGVTYTRFTGYVDEWPVVWADASATLATVSITASSRMARLGREAALPSIIEIEYLADSPTSYYPLGDAVGSLNAGNVSTVTQPQMAVTPFGGGSTANVTFGAAGPVTASGTAVSFTRVSSTAGAYLAAPTTANPFFGCVLIECFFSSSSTQAMGIVSIDNPGGSPASYALSTSASGKLVGSHVGGLGGSYTITSTATVTDGLTHHIALREASNGAADMFLDGVNVGSGSIANGADTVSRLVVGGNGSLNPALVGTVSNAAVTVGAFPVSSPNPMSDNRILQHYLAGSTGFSGERSDQRISRLAGYAQIPSGEVAVETGLSTSIMAQDTTGQIPLQLMQDVTATENGVLFDSMDGKFTFQSRSHRYNQSSSLTLRGSDLLPSLTPKLDDQGLINDITASRAGGVTTRAVDTNSVNEYGLYHLDLTLLTTSDLEVFDAASWALSLGATPQVIVPVAEVELASATTAMKAAILGRGISDRITLASLPSQAPAPSIDFVIEGWTETMDTVTHRVAFNLSNAADAGVWQMDSAVYSVADSTTRFGY